MANSIMVVSSGFYDDVRVRKMASSVVDFAGIDRVVVVASRRPLPQHVMVGGLKKGVTVVRLAPAVAENAPKLFKIVGRGLFLVSALVVSLRRSEPGDVIHCNDLDVALVGIVLRLRGRRFLLDCHELYADRYGVTGVARRLLRALERVAVQRCEVLVSVSDSARRHLLRQYGQRRSVVVTNSRGSDEIRIPSLQPKSSRGLRIIYAGRLSEGRGLRELVRAARLLPPDVSLTLLGWGPMRDSLRRMVPHQVGHARVEFRDPVDLHSVVEVMAEYDMGAVLTEPAGLNHQLTVSNKLFEYAAAGLPVLLSDVAEHQRLNRRYAFGVVCRPVAEEIASSISGLTMDDLHSMAMGAWRMADDRSWEREVARLQPLYVRSPEAGQ